MEHFDKRDWYPELEGLSVKINLDKSEIRRFYNGANIFITGGAGFLGSLLIEKIARSCPDFGKIYLLLRPKRGLTTAQRLEKLFTDDIYWRLKKENPDFISRICVMEGDLAFPMCGLSEENIQIIKDEVNIIYHIAACLRMVEPLSNTYTMNVKATKDLLDLGLEMKQLKAFVYVSTAYSNCFRSKIEETFYEPYLNSKEFGELVENMDEESLCYLTPKVLGPWVNTYSFSKAIAEDMIKLYIGKIPVAIARPSIVIGCAEEPLSNWINNVYGVTGVALGASIGVIRVWYADPGSVADIIPADYVVNTMISISWITGKKFVEGTHIESPIYNVVSSPRAATSWREYTYLSSLYAMKDKVACVQSIGEYGFFLTNMKWLWYLSFWIIHLGQGIIVDTILRIVGREPMLIKGYVKIMRFNLQLAFFGERQWIYEQPNVDELLEVMNEDDKKLFPFDMSNFDWKGYHMKTVRAVLKYIVKSKDLEDRSRAHQHYLRFMRARHTVVFLSRVAFVYGVVKICEILATWATTHF